MIFYISLSGCRHMIFGSAIHCKVSNLFLQNLIASRVVPVETTQLRCKQAIDLLTSITITQDRGAEL